MFWSNSSDLLSRRYKPRNGLAFKYWHMSIALLSNNLELVLEAEARQRRDVESEVKGLANYATVLICHVAAWDGSLACCGEGRIADQHHNLQIMLLVKAYAAYWRNSILVFPSGPRSPLSSGFFHKQIARNGSIEVGRHFLTNNITKILQHYQIPHHAEEYLFVPPGLNMKIST